MLKAVLFDLDGVLVDSYEYTVVSFQRTLAFFNKKVPKKQDFDGLLGLTAYGILEKLQPDAEKEHVDELFERFKIESDIALPMIKMFDQVDEIVKKLSKKYKLAIVSNRRTYSVHNLLKLHKLTKYFTTVIGREDVTHHKPHPEPVLKALAKLQVKPKDSIYIGDMKEDVLAAKAAGVRSIFIAGERKNDYGADYIVKKISEVQSIIKKIHEK